MSSRAIILTFLLAITAIVFAPVLGNDFVIQDDYGWIAAHPRLNPPSFENLAWFWSPRNPTEGLWVPLSYTVWSVLSLFSHKPSLFHAASLMLHLTSVIMVWTILRRLIASDVSAAIGTMVFAVHPLQVESVAWASGMKDLLAALLSLVAIDQYIRSIDTSGRARAMHYLACIAMLIAAMFSKPSAVVMPVMALIIDRWMLRGEWRAVLPRVVPLLVLTIPCIIWSRIAQTMYPELATDLMIRPFVAADAIAFYLYKLVWPMTLVNLYGRRPDVIQAQGWLLVTWLVPATLAAVLFAIRRRYHDVIAGSLIFLVAISPVLGFTPFLFQLYSTVADHYMYLPMFGVAIAAAAIAIRLESKPFMIAAAVVVVALGARSSLQARYWKNSVMLFAHTVEHYPWNIQAQDGFGRALAAAGRLPEALPHFRIVVDSQPENPQAQLVIGRALLELGDYRSAAAHLEYAARLKPDDPLILSLLAQATSHLASPATTQ
jgi:hypothetical protein